jgi:hypothetical protein
LLTALYCTVGLGFILQLPNGLAGGNRTDARMRDATIAFQLRDSFG